MNLYLHEMENYQIKISKSGHKVPVINDVHLHSSYDPIKEASAFIDKVIKQPPQENYLILGLGFGYHVQELVSRLEKQNVTPQIVIIEPNNKTASDCFELEILGVHDHYYVVGKTPDEIYGNKDLTQFLLQKPQVISHTASFNLYANYFRDLLSYNAPNFKEDLIKRVSSPTLSEYLCSQDFVSTDDLYENILQSDRFHSETDILIAAMLEITKNSDILTNR
jgi:hypothetical protein